MDEVQLNHHDHKYSNNELVEMKDHASKIERIQKWAKCVINVLNYKDIVTTKD